MIGVNVVATEKLTFDEFGRLPVTDFRYELVDGPLTPARLEPYKIFPD